MFHLMLLMIKAGHCCPNYYIVRQPDEKTPLVERMRERCAEVPGRGLCWHCWERRGLAPAHSDVTMAFEYAVNPPEFFVLVVSMLTGIACAFQSSICMTGSY